MNFENKSIWTFFGIAEVIAVFTYLTDVDISDVIFCQVFPIVVDSVENIDFLLDRDHLIASGWKKFKQGGGWISLVVVCPEGCTIRIQGEP